MIWADRVALVLTLPGILLGIIADPGGPPFWELWLVFVAALWVLMRGVDFIATGEIRRRHSLR